MKITVFSDVHGDIYSLEKLVRAESADQYICLGDLVGYGPHSNSCLDLAFELCGEQGIVLGNHEYMFLNESPFDNCSELAKKFFHHSFSHYVPDERLNRLAETISIPNDFPATFTHTLDNIHIYPNTKKTFDQDGMVFIGHSHIQFAKHHLGMLNIINVGSLGQNRKNKNIASYVNYFPSENAFEFCSFESEKNKLISDMLSLGYESELIDYYK